MLQITAELIDRYTIGPAQELTLRASGLARALVPGQAVLVKCGWGLEPYLRRTFYPIAVADETWTLRVPPGGDWGHAWLRAAPVGTPSIVWDRSGSGISCRWACVTCCASALANWPGHSCR